MPNEIDVPKLNQIGLKTSEPLIIGEGSIGINGVVGFSGEFGGNPLRAIPARFLAGFLPAFLLAETVREQTGITPTVRIFFPKNIAHHVNGLDIPRLDITIKVVKKVIEALHHSCFPSTQLMFQEDQLITSSAVATLDRFSILIDAVEDRDVLKSIHESAQRHGGQRGEANTTLYAAHHPFGWQEVGDRNIFDEDLPHIVINTLPVSERRFSSLRRGLRASIHTLNWDRPREVHDLEMSTVGAHYLLIDPSEPTLEDALFLPMGIILEKLTNLYRATGNDNLRKAKNDCKRLVEFVAERTQRNVTDAVNKTLSELLGGVALCI